MLKRALLSAALLPFSPEQWQNIDHEYDELTVEAGTGAVLLGEVSQCNDDNTDNRFNPPMGRFPEIEEDEALYRLLCNENPKAK